VKDQLQALDNGSFPRLPQNVEAWETCQDWQSTAPPSDGSDQFIYDASAGCTEAYSSCETATSCFNHKAGCSVSGELVYAECEAAALCAPCFPKSRCGTLQDTDGSDQMIYDASAGCTEAYSSCEEAAPCFNHKAGCSVSGEFVFADCEAAALCAPCFPKSRCGTMQETTDSTDSSTRVKTWMPVAIASAVIAMYIF